MPTNYQLCVLVLFFEPGITSQQIAFLLMTLTRTENYPLLFFLFLSRYAASSEFSKVCNLWNLVLLLASEITVPTGIIACTVRCDNMVIQCLSRD